MKISLFSLFLLLTPTLVMAKDASLKLDNSRIIQLIDEKLGERVFIEDKSGKKLEVKNPDEKLKSQRTGSKANIKGSLSAEGKIALDSADYLDDQEPAQILAPKKILILLCTHTGEKPATIEQIRSTVFNEKNSVKEFYLHNSFGKQDISGDVFGWFSIRASDSKWDIYDVGAKCNQAAQKSQVKISGYTHIAYVFPKLRAAQGELGGSTMWMYVNPTRSYVHNSFMDSFAHELGHNLGLSHTNSYGCNKSNPDLLQYGPWLVQSPATDCTDYEYGDSLTVMGGGNVPRDLHGMHRQTLGYTDASHTNYITKSGTYELYAQSMDTTRHKMIGIPLKNTKFNQGGNHFLFLEKYGPFGIALDYNRFSSPLMGVTMRVSTPPPIPYYYKTHFLKRKKNLDSSGSYVDYQSFLKVDEPVEFDWEGINIKLLSEDNEKAVLQIDMKEIVCQEGNPSVSLSPSKVAIVAGASMQYSMSITNNDASNCPVKEFVIAQKMALPSGWSRSVASNSVSLLPGQSKNVNFSITTSSATTAGNYSIDQKISRQNSNDVYAVASIEIVSSATAPKIKFAELTDGTVLSGKGRLKMSVITSDFKYVSSIKLYIDGIYVNSCFDSSTCDYAMGMRDLNSGNHVLKAVAVDHDGMPTQRAETAITVVMP